MVSPEHVGKQFTGVLHGMDDEGNTIQAPYAVRSKNEVLDYARHLGSIGIRVNEQSHEGPCSGLTCNFGEPSDG